MKLHMVAPHYPPYDALSGRWVREVGSRLAEGGQEVVVHTRDRGPDSEKLPPREEQPSGLTVRRYRATLGLGDQVVLYKPRIEEGIVMLHGYGVVVNDVVRDGYDGGPVLCHLHHGIDPPTRSLLGTLFKTVYNPLVPAPGLKECAGVVTSTAQDHSELVKMGLDPRRLHIGPYGVPAERLDRLADPAPGEEEGDFVLFPAPLDRAHRPMDLLEALAGVSSGRAVFAGNGGPTADWLEEHARELGLADRVTVVRDPDEATLDGLVRASRAVVLPHEATFPVGALRAWCQGRPVVAARTDGVPWVVEEGRTGLLYPRGDVGALRDHLRTVLQDDKRAEQMGRTGRDRVKHFTWERITEGVEGFLKEVVEDAETDAA